MSCTAILEKFSIPKNYTEDQKKWITRAIMVKTDPIKYMKKKKKQRQKNVVNSNIAPVECEKVFEKAVKYFEMYDLKPVLITASMSVKIQLEKSVRNLITYRLPRIVNNKIVGNLYFNVVKNDNDIEKLKIDQFDIKRDNYGQFKINRITLEDVLEIMTEEKIRYLKIIAKRIDNEYRYNQNKKT